MGRRASFGVIVTSLFILLTSVVVFAQPRHQSQILIYFVDTAISCSGITPAPGNYIVDIESSSQTREFRLHIPPGYLPGHAAPLVINLHGAGGTGRQQELYSRMSGKADEAGFIAVHPEGRGDPQTWYVGPTVSGQQEDVQFMRDLITCLKKQLSIDANRIYATGFSNGGGMANRLGCDLSDVIAAIAPVSGAYFFHDNCPTTRPVISRAIIDQALAA
jgi:polyhydroxybutyrate depolymerase